MATHLTLEERYQIQVLLRFGADHNKIARSLARSRSTIDREIKRNKAPNGSYQADRADALPGRGFEAAPGQTLDASTRPFGSAFMRICIT